MHQTKTISLAMDLQDKLTAGLKAPNDLIESNCLWLKVCDLLDLKVIITEQVPEKLGHTNEKIMDHSRNRQIIRKSSFSAFGCKEFSQIIANNEIQHIYLSGVESSICIYLTALDAIKSGLQVTIIEDCVAGRREKDSQTALLNHASMGASVLPLETIIYSLVVNAEHVCFKAITKLISSRR